MNINWDTWFSGDAIAAPSTIAPLQAHELIIRIADSFARIELDWRVGDTYVAARIAKATSLGLPPLVMDAEKGLLGRTAFVSVTGFADPSTVSFFVLPETNIIELHYEPLGMETQSRALAVKLATKLGYAFDSGEP